ncbi:hypothetical protein LTR85_007963 [Meristemomyces frigidus]|nr:hypothetical protein LTR85_007963 [Meristemomyces frigidus]
MRLINTTTLALEEFLKPPEYAILSHRWEAEEVSYEQYVSQQPPKSAFRKVFAACRSPDHRFSKEQMKGAGYRKVAACCALAKTRGFDWVWIDTCCIDKRSSAELSEAINSMWTWYANSEECLVYLSDVEGHSTQHDNASSDKAHERVLEQFQASAWFTRGWTLQELLAPMRVTFCDRHWRIFYDLWKSKYFVEVNLWPQKEYFAAMVAASGIAVDCLVLNTRITHACVAERMSWAARRQTTRLEDTAYCLLGIFDINMPLLYGEGRRAFLCLQEEIIRRSNDESIFAWNFVEDLTPQAIGICRVVSTSGLLASDPSYFLYSGDVGIAKHTTRQPYTITNKGLEFEGVASVARGDNTSYTRYGFKEVYIVYLNCGYGDQKCAIALGKPVQYNAWRSDDVYARYSGGGSQSLIELYPLDVREDVGVKRFYIQLT